MKLLREPTITRFPARVTSDSERPLRELAVEHLHPQVGQKRQTLHPTGRLKMYEREEEI
jgi:hypothetical protein